MVVENQLPSHAEKRAAQCESLTAFSGLNLLHIRRSVKQLLGLIGRDGIFDEYTIHDISHIDSMLESLEWLIPDSTKEIMSPADWLMTTLSIYFHDLGMLVTKREYDDREKSDYPRYRDEVLFGKPNGADYKAKVMSLPGDRPERFLYQEFVRHKHAERVRAWISGTVRDDLGNAQDAANEIDSLLAPLGALFRRDLGVICESHHLNDLNEIKKYKPSQPYGNSDQETANLQYCAVLLRSADLLHITSDRTPSVTFKTINPTDPISQDEWAKQRAVRRVKPKIGVNEEQIPDPKAQQDTIEVHAFFTDENGFFGLTQYLIYAAGQLKQSNEWITTTKKHNLAQHDFPWRKIDDSQIETDGFIRESFEFQIDQAKILDLLTGHTLYNDTRVVIRELVQNAIDAIRLEWYEKDPAKNGKVQVIWDSQKRELSVIDNGTGMSQEIISNFLLKVGTSRYQDPEFKKQYPSFSSISRFGIGVLSTFMIADSVDITTCHPDDDKARRLTLRSVHGKYLIRLLEKSDADVKAVVPHGTQFKLRIRPSVKIPDVLQTTKLWVVVPRCAVTVAINSTPPANVGSNSPAEALQAVLREHGVSAEISADSRPPADSMRTPVRILERCMDGITLAYAVRWSSYFQEWSFVEERTVPRLEKETSISLGTCIEGIRVEQSSPGYEGPRVLAIANVTGPNAPKTNVARSGLEATAERDTMLRGIYEIYSGHVGSEIAELQTTRAFSLTWAVQEANYLLSSIYGVSETAERGARPISARLLKDAVSDVKFLVVERSGTRLALAPAALAAESGFWTIDSGLLRSAEPLIREGGPTGSLSRILETLNIPNFTFPDGLVLCGLSPTDHFSEFAFANREVDRIAIHREHRRVDLHWTNAIFPKRWLSFPERGEASLIRYSQRRSVRRPGRTDGSTLLVASGDIEISPAASCTAVIAFDHIFILPGSRLNSFLSTAINEASDAQTTDAFVALSFVFAIVETCCNHSGPIDVESVIRSELRRAEAEWPVADKLQEYLSKSGLAEVIASTDWTTFNPSRWRRQPSPVF